jgi:hypothetical protein
MDPVTAALSQAWLQAASRIQSQPTAQPPRQEPPKTLVDVFERVLRHADPLAGNVSSGRLLDRLV